MNKKKVSKTLLVFISIFSLLVGFILGSCIKHFSSLPESDKVISGDLKIHFLELGNGESGDCTLIQIGEYDILVDAGSDVDSLETIKKYLDSNLQDNTLEYVIVTHAHKDHYANFAGDGKTSLLSYYKTDTIIQFSNTDQEVKGMYENYLSMIEKEKQEGAIVYDVLQCYNNQDGCNRTLDLGFGVQLEFLYNYYYDHYSDEDEGGENNYSICFMINQGDNHFLFTADLEEAGEKKLIEYNTLPKMTLYKAGHHGSNTSSSSTLLEVITPEIVVIQCVAGSYQYSNKPDNTFPTTKTLERISQYTDKVYVTTQGISEYKNNEYVDVGFKSLNGDIVITSNNKGLNVTGSNNSLILKESDWYKTNRNNITNWK